MALDGCSQLCKCILILVNIVLGLLGFAIMALGLWVRFSAQTRGIFNVDLNTTSFLIVVTLLIVLGALMLVISAFGNFGAFSESKGALTVFWSLPGFSSEDMRNILDQSISYHANFFSFLISFFSVMAIASYEVTEFVVLLSFLLTFTIAAGTLAIVKSEEVGKLLSDTYATTYAQYVDKGGDPSMAIMLQFFHNMFDCCGILGSLEPVVRETCPKKAFLESFTVQPCPSVIANKDYRSPAFMGGFFGMLALMVFAVVCCSIFMNGIKHSQASFPIY